MRSKKTSVLRTYFRLGLVLFAVSIISLSGNNLLAQETPIRTNGDVVYASPPQEPTEVEVGLFLIGLNKISPPSDAIPTFEAELFMDLRWDDPRLAFDSDKLGIDRKVYEEQNALAALNETWWPDIEIENEAGKRITENMLLIISPNGAVEYEERFTAVMHADFDLRKYPFDKQTLEIDLESFSWDRRYVNLVTSESIIGWSEDFHTPEWEITGLETAVTLEKEIRSDTEFVELIFTIHVQRHSSYYIWRTFLPLFLIIGVGIMLLWKPAAERTSNAIFVFLIIVGYHSISANSLPKLNHLTVMDGYFLIGFICAVTIILESFIVERMTSHENQVAIATKIDAAMKWLLPTTVVLAVGALTFSILVLGF